MHDPSLRKWKQLAAATCGALCLIALSGCWDVGKEAVITWNVAEAIPYSGNQYVTPDGDTYTWAQTGTSHDYRYTETDKNGQSVETGQLRVMNIRDNIYAVQMKSDSDDTYNVELFAISSSGITKMQISASDDAAANSIARQNGIGNVDTVGAAAAGQQMNDVLTADQLTGTPDQILGFLRGLSAVHFEPAS